MTSTDLKPRSHRADPFLNGFGASSSATTHPWPWRRVLAGVLSLALMNGVVAFLGANPVARTLLLLAMLFTPGYLVLRWSGQRMNDCAARAVVMLAVSLTVHMLVGFAVTGVCTVLGVSRPLSTAPLLIGLDLVLLVMTVGGLSRPRLVAEGLSWLTWRQGVWVSVSLLIPVLSWAGAARLNNGLSPTMAILATCAAGLMLALGFVVAPRLDLGLLALLLAGVSAALILSYSTRGSYVYGFDIQQEFGIFAEVHENATWHVPKGTESSVAYRAMLSITILPQVLVSICHIAPLEAFRLVLPLTLAAVPTGVFAFLVARTSRRVAFMVATLAVLLPQFSTVLPSVTRQAVASSIFGAILLVLFDARIGARNRTWLGSLLCIGMVISHYSTSYVAAVLLGMTWLVVSLVRVFARGRRTGPRLITTTVMLSLVGSCLLWNVAITHSVGNVEAFIVGANNSGLRIFPERKEGESLLGRWLNLTTGGFVDTPDYSESVRDEYRNRYHWIEQYDEEKAAEFPLMPVETPDATVKLPRLHQTVTRLATLVNQLMLLATVAGALMLLWSARSHRDTLIELPLLLGVALSFTAFARISGFLAESYNADRLYQQTFVILAIGIAYLASVGWHSPDGRELDQTIHLRRVKGNAERRMAPLAFAAAVLFSSTTQCIDFVDGGSDLPAYSNKGEAVERFVYTSSDVEAAQWVNREVPSRGLLFVDRYGVLPLWGQGNQMPGVFTTIAPSAIDKRGYVFLTTVNLVQRRARGNVGYALTSFTTPVGFYDKYKSLLYSNNEVRIYR